MREERERRGWGQAELASRLAAEGVPLVPSAISKSEAGHRLVRLNEAVAVAAVFGLPLGALLTEAGKRDERIAELRTEAARLSEESDDALRRALYFRNEAALLAGEQT
jgi:transcriptional regulator with XRE-family HTH domain